ncbi:MAG: glycosyltransferase family 4 protein [Acidobacteriota bacterium]
MSIPGRRHLTVWHLLVGLDRGGAERLLTQILPLMSQHAIETRVLALKGPGPTASDLEDAGIPVEALAGTGRADPRPVLRLLRRLRAGRPDVVHAHLSRAVLAASWTTSRTRTPLIAHVHSLAGERARWQERLEARACRRAQARIAVSAAVARERENRLGLPAGAFHVLPNGIDTSSLAAIPSRPPCPGRPLQVGFLGRLLIRAKGLDVLLDAAGLLLSDGRGGRLSIEIAGGPAQAAGDLHGQLRRRKLTSMVTLRGSVPGPAEVLRGWDVLVLPSRSEGFGLVLLEAMAAGRAVVATRQGGIPEVVEDGTTGLLVAPGDAGELARALGRLEEDRELVCALGRAGRRRTRERFDREPVAAGWADLARVVARGSQEG